MNRKAFLPKSGAGLALMLGMMLGTAGMAQGAALLTLKGDTPAVKQTADGELRLSLLSFSDDISIVAKAYDSYRQDNDAEALSRVLEEQKTQGYLFTKAAAGYTVKYAWQDPSDMDHLVLMVTPALKTRNPYMWTTPNEGAVPFTLLDLRKEGDTFSVKTSLDAEVGVNDAGLLDLQDHDSAPVFATLKDATPYYAQQSS